MGIATAEIEERAFIATPEPGIYEDVPAATYHQWDAMSKSWVNKFHDTSPKHFQYERKHPTPPTKAMVEGQILHKLCLEALDFAVDYIVVDDVDKRTKAGKEAVKAAKAVAGGREPVVEKTFTQCRQMVLALMSHRPARELFTGGQPEVSLVWDDDETGVRCKARLDYLLSPLIGDIKSCRSGDEYMFAKAIYELGYHVQDAFYQDGAAANGIDVDQFLFATVESHPPFDVVIYTLDDLGIVAGRHTYKDVLRRYKKCRDTNHWPGRAEDRIVEIGLPKYALAKEGLLERIVI